MKNKIFLVVFMMFSLMFTSCVKLPQVELDSAIASIQETKDLGADLYVPESFTALQDSVTKVTESIEVKKSKLFKSYKKEKELLITINSMVIDVKAKTEARKAELTLETQNLITEVRGLIETNKELITKAPKGKDGRVVIAAINEELLSLESIAIEVESRLANGDIIGANEQIKAAKSSAVSIQTELNTVIEKVKK